eukprot:m.332709 g.332709  ORF g.332709 m.332709 type:complete len:70 (+) comp20494_c0_seq10:548-757(+)
MRSNPFAPRVPCHRVVASNLDVGGYFGQWGQGTSKVAAKIALLKREGVTFQQTPMGTTRVKRHCLWRHK